MIGIDFNNERDKGKLKIDKEFEGSFNEKLGFSKYMCPYCSAHLKEVDGDLICLNGCHMPRQWNERFSEKMKMIQDKVKA